MLYIYFQLISKSRKCCLATRSAKNKEKSTRTSLKQKPFQTKALEFGRDSLNASTITKRKSEETIDAEEETQIIANLKKGYIMTKHSENTKSKSKFVYLSLNQKYLCWKSVDKQDEKRLKVSDIYQIVKNGSDYMIKKNNSIKSVDSCVVLVAESRTLFLEAHSISQANYFEQQMQKVLRYCQKMSLNYLYTND